VNRKIATPDPDFTSVDPLMASASVIDPQSLNRYSYVENHPTNFTDPTGMALSDIGVYQTANPEVADILENKMVELFRQAIRPPDPPAHSGGGEHHGGPQPSGGEHNHSERIRCRRRGRIRKIS